jgi:TolB-like protein/Tfp pilus assembly protein PilF
MNTELALSDETSDSENHCCCICGMKLLAIEEGLSGDFGPQKKQLYCLKCWFLAWRGYPKFVHHSREHFGYSSSPLSEAGSLDQLESKSIAILPLENENQEGEERYFCDGLTEDIIDQLTRISDIRVISWTSVTEYRNSDKALREICDELGVSAILSGGIHKEGDQLELELKLSGGPTGETLWQENYDGSISDYFIILGKLVLKIASILEANVTAEEAQTIRRIPTESIGAYEYYLRGRGELDRQEKSRNERAIEFLNKALELDPDFALAYAGLGEAYLQRVHRHGSSATWLESSIEMAEKAIALDPKLAEAHSTLSLVYYLKGWFSQALLQDRKAIAINPNLPSAIYGLGYDYLVLGDLAETLRWLGKAVTLDPRDAGNHQQIGRIFMALGKNDEAELWFRRSLELNPDYVDARHQLGYLYLNQGDLKAALGEAEAILSLSPESPHATDLVAAVELIRGDFEKVSVACQKILGESSMAGSLLTKSAAYRLAFVLWSTGRKNEANRLFDIQVKQHQEALKKGDQSWVPRFFLASIHAVQGSKETACSWLKKAIEAGFRDCSYFDLYEDWNQLQDYEQFEEILTQFKGDLEKMRRRAEAMSEQHFPRSKKGVTELKSASHSEGQQVDKGKE